MIIGRVDGKFEARHTPSGQRRVFDSYLAAKTWMIVLDDRLGTQGWRINLDCLFTDMPPPRDV